MANPDRGHQLLSSSLYNSLEAAEKREERKDGCVGRVGRRERCATLLMNILEGPLLCEEKDK